MKRVQDRSDVTAFRSFNNNTGKRVLDLLEAKARKPVSADRTARRQFQATGQPVSRTQASDTMTSRLPHYEAKCVLPMRVGPLRSDMKGTELPLPIY